jgi:competence protein ComGC
VKLTTFWSNSQRGFSLVQIMVAFALVGVLSLIMMRMFDQQNQLTGKVKSDNELNEVQYHFLNMLNDKIACEANLQSMKKGDEINFFRVDDGDPFATVGERFKNLGIKITGMKILTDAEVTASGQTPQLVRVEDGRSMIVFRVKFERLGNVIGGKTKFKDFHVSVVLGEHKWETGPTATSVKNACVSNGSFKVADSNFVVKDSYQPPNPGDEPAKCNGNLCIVDCVKFNGAPANLRILACITPGP